MFLQEHDDPHAAERGIEADVPLPTVERDEREFGERENSTPVAAQIAPATEQTSDADQTSEAAQTAPPTGPTSEEDQASMATQTAPVTEQMSDAEQTSEAAQTEPETEQTSESDQASVTTQTAPVDRANVRGVSNLRGSAGSV